jgi:hypothetical protein
MAATSISSTTSKMPPPPDLEHGTAADKLLLNTTVDTLAWNGVTVTVKDRETKQAKNIVDNVSGLVEAGTLLSAPHLPPPFHPATN